MHTPFSCSISDTVTVYIFFSAPEEAPLVRQWLHPLPNSNRLIFVPQIQSPTLGDRLAHATSFAFASGGHRQVAIIGTDVPDLRKEHIQQSFACLKSGYDAVFGPSVDGGYYLLALSSSSSTTMTAIFQNITWSTDTVLQQNAANITAIGLEVAPLDQLPRLRDIDTVTDLHQWWSTALPTKNERQQQEEEEIYAISRTILQSSGLFECVTLQT